MINKTITNPDNTTTVVSEPGLTLELVLTAGVDPILETTN